MVVYPFTPLSKSVATFPSHPNLLPEGERRERRGEEGEEGEEGLRQGD